ncbi:MAG: hypothetical protein ACRDC4_06880 [Plesiomonas sp.]
MNDRQQLSAMGEHMREMEESKPEFKVPDGWRLVPVEPTDDMVNAAIKVSLRNPSINGVPQYRAMLAAAPEYKP